MKFEYWDFNDSVNNNLQANVLAISDNLRKYSGLFDQTEVIQSDNHGAVECYVGSIDVLPVYKLASISSAYKTWINELEVFKSQNLDLIGQASFSVRYAITPGEWDETDPEDPIYIPATASPDGYYNYEVRSGGNKSTLLDENINVYGQFFRTFNSSDNYIFGYNRDTLGTAPNGDATVSTSFYQLWFSYNIPSALNHTAMANLITTITSEKNSAKATIISELNTNHKFGYDVLNATGLVDDWMEEVDGIDETKVTNMVVAPMKLTDRNIFNLTPWVNFDFDNEESSELTPDDINDIIENTSLDSEVEIYEHIAKFEGEEYLRSDSKLGHYDKLYLYTKFTTIYFRQYRPSRSTWVKFRNMVIDFAPIALAAVSGNPYMLALTFASLAGAFDNLSTEQKAAIQLSFAAYGYYSSDGGAFATLNTGAQVANSYIGYSTAKINQETKKYAEKTKAEIEALKELEKDDSPEFIYKSENYSPLSDIEDYYDNIYDVSDYEYKFK